MYEVGDDAPTQRISPNPPQQEITFVARLAGKIHLCR